MRHDEAAPATVWLCRNDDHAAARGLPVWLRAAVRTIVTIYSQPGDRVLLLVPPIERGNPPNAGLHDAAETVVALGRSVDTLTVRTRTAAADSATPFDLTPCILAGTGDATRSESGPGPTAGPHRQPPPTATQGSESDDPTHPDRAPVPTDRDRFDLIITAAAPQAAGWLSTTAWRDHLVVPGTLAVITHSEHEGGRLVDPTRLVVAAAHRAGLSYLDHIALLEIPVRHGRLAAPDLLPAAGNTPGSVPPAPRFAGPTPPPGLGSSVALRVHSDLHVFRATPPQAAATAQHHDQETSDA